MNRRRVAVLGSTGSIGRQALEIISREPGLALHSIVCRSSTGLLSEQMAEYSPAIAGAVEPHEAPPAGVFTGEHAVDRAMEEADVVLNAIVGSAGLRASLLAQKSGKPLALANKESLVVGGDLLRKHLNSGAVIPVDSEHSTIFRCLLGEDRGVSSITLTASGGSCRSMTPEEVRKAGPERILRHPTWNMGARITVDSASMVNKAFEVIEARWLFPGVPVNAVVHPQSIVHSLVRLQDGSWKALLGEPDMRIPIQFALQYPAGRLRAVADDGPLDWGTLEFRELDPAKYPSFRIVLEAAEMGKSYPAAVNAADEVAVRAFLEGRIDFGKIPHILDRVIELHRPVELTDLQDVLEADSRARELAERTVNE